MITTIQNRNDLNKFNQQAYRCVLKASASWCRPCKDIAPFYQQLSNNFAALWFGQFDVDQAADVASLYNVQAMPTFLLIQQGQVLQVLKGPSRNELQRAVAAFSRINH